MISISRCLLVPISAAVRLSKSHLFQLSSDWISLHLVALALQVPHILLNQCSFWDLIYFESRSVSPINEWLVIQSISTVEAMTDAQNANPPELGIVRETFPWILRQLFPFHQSGSLLRVHDSFKDQRNSPLFSNLLLCRPEIDVSNDRHRTTG
ncbi:hypothetical protein DEU56DRAFT_580803 [Suillus clintonianus]|uniref:uncharacterized protein n=1 Tax=Suillus clintonianus TaxID=1904413 RepID=UPI001B863E7F|nr:uncharacterized protein DEU56DRAFT_580803 [Suillus clintonianus]KAG2150927.1 hypothetical protein DEU56DRAFT_580803 [Suillus clintonianus]